MRLSTKYFLLTGTLHVALGTTSYLLLIETKIWFILAEIFLLISFLFTCLLYRDFIRPIRMMERGTDALLDSDFNVTYVKTGTRELDKLIEVFNEMINRIREERVSLKEQHYFLEKLIEASPNGIMILDFDGNLSTANRYARELLGIEEGIVLSSIDHPIAKEAMQLSSGEQRMVKVNGWQQYKCYASHFIHQGFQRKFIIIENLSNEILQSEKEAYGKIIRMMAHEVNNSIGAISSILHTVKEIYTEGPHQEPDAIDALEVAIHRNDLLNQFMKNFAEVARLPEPRLEKINLMEVVQRMVTFFTPQLKEKNINIIAAGPDSEVWIHADEAQLEQVFVNVIKNAMEAIGVSGKIEIRVSPNAELKITDTGGGIPDDVIQQLFQPFYSSKPQGQGVGLTLVKEILHQHGASFSLKNGEKGQAVFSIQFRS